ncbi:MerR family transcriptional regulator [Roseateles depolymerans]|uniref:Transcriptional regulator, MerR family n=1 Tax=Roseateles depolymerans TaxID=76731 RepID=A0A0U3MVE8_9BURK|nr:MerR family transcriptional regulator [Roseateles depolymerans]ALV05908.1 Transcriptional regulator, MerR family [Roseateles depolymerans]REG12818.1 DNA-binding transcriptional MerR regulator [Roseateles depolymerans]
MDITLPAIPAKRYFTIGEVSELCGVKPYVLRYWEQEFTQLKPMKRRGNRRYYQHHEVLLIRRIRDLLYDQGFTISGARNQLSDSAHGTHTGHSPATQAQEFRAEAQAAAEQASQVSHLELEDSLGLASYREVAREAYRDSYRARAAEVSDGSAHTTVSLEKLSLEEVREELLAIRESLLA